MTSPGSSAAFRPSRRLLLIAAGVVATALAIAGAALALRPGVHGALAPVAAGTSTAPASAGPTDTPPPPAPSPGTTTGSGGGAVGGSGGGSGGGPGPGDLPQLPPPAAPPGAPPLARPTNLVLTPLDRSRIRLTWQDNSTDETGFELFYLNGGAYGFIAATSAGTTSYVWDTGWGGGTTWCGAIRAVRETAPYTASQFYPSPPATVCATTPVPPPPAAPSNLTTTLLATAAILVRWTDNADNETSYWIETSDPNGVMGAHSGRMDPNRTEFNTGSLSPGTRYCFRVKASNEGGDSAWSNTACAQTQALPAMPSSISVAFVDPTTVRVTWVDNSSDETSFGMVLRSDPPGSYATLRRPAANTTEIQVTNVPTGIRVCVQMTAQNLSGTSGPTAWACADPPTGT